MEQDKFKILNNFLDDSSELLESEYRENFVPLRDAYKKELVQPGCTQCIRNACRAKYTQRIMGILNSEIDPKAPPPSAAKPPVRQQPNPPQNSNASQRQQPPGYVSPELIPPNPGGNKEVVEPGVSQEEKQENEVQDITRAPFGKL